MTAVPDEVPALGVELGGNRRRVVACPFCGRLHIHGDEVGMINGRRMATCGGGEYVMMEHFGWERPSITPNELQDGLLTLELSTPREAAIRVLGDPKGAGRVALWLSGRQRIPDWVARNLRAELEMADVDSWPSTA